MTHLTKPEVESTARIFNYVNVLIGNYYGPAKSPAAAKKFVSANRWIMFPDRTIESLREGTTMPNPNIFISFGEEILDDGAGIPVVGSSIGMTFNNTESMQWYRSVAPRFLAALSSLPGWQLEIQNKIKLDYYASAPEYETVTKIEAIKATQQWINDSLASAEVQRPKRDQFWNGHTVEWSLPIIVMFKSVDHNTYDADIKSISVLLRTL